MMPGMNNKRLGLILLAMVIVGELLIGQGSAEVYPDAGFKTDWQGKVLVVSTRPNQHVAYLERVSVRRLGDQWFMVGSQMEFSKETWTEGKVTWVAMSDVSSIVEVAGTEEMKKILNQFPAR
jgi:hypothetical protein